MKRSDIVRSMQVKFKHMRATDAAAILDTVSDHMIESCTGQPMPLPASTTILFKPSRELTKKMNGQ